MDEFLIHFMNELGANLFLAKNFFFFVETLAKGLSQFKTGSMSPSVSMMTWLAFWNGVAHYFFGLYGKASDRSFHALFSHLDKHPELVPASKVAYYQAISARAKSTSQNELMNHYDMEHLFHDVVNANELYVNLCNLYDIRGGGQNLHITDKERMFM